MRESKRRGRRLIAADVPEGVVVCVAGAACEQKQAPLTHHVAAFRQVEQEA